MKTTRFIYLNFLFCYNKRFINIFGLNTIHIYVPGSVHVILPRRWNDVRTSRNVIFLVAPPVTWPNSVPPYLRPTLHLDPHPWRTLQLLPGLQALLNMNILSVQVLRLRLAIHGLLFLYGWFWSLLITYIRVIGLTLPYLCRFFRWE